MKAVLLAGGLGTRLREQTEFRPKPMVEVGGKPMLWHIMKIFAHHGFHDFVICVGYQGHVIKEYFLNYEAFNSDFTTRLGSRTTTVHHGSHPESQWQVTVADTGADTGTGGRIKRIAEYIGDDQLFMATYGDGLADVDLGALLAFHRAHGRVATLTAVQPPLRFGIVELGAGDRVEKFQEKPRSEDWVSGGFFVFDRKIFDYLADDCTLEAEPLQQLAAEEQLVAYRHRGFWQPMDTYRESTLLNQLWATDQAPWKVWS